MKRAEILSEAGILKEKVRLVSLLLFHSLLVGKASSNIHFKAVPGSFNITIDYQTYMYFRCKNHSFPFFSLISFVCVVGRLSDKSYKKVRLVAFKA